VTPADYIERGWAIVPIPAGEKGPKIREWQNRAFTPDDFAADNNVGVKLGRLSGSLVGIDLDCPEALDLADLYLPQTGAVFGRTSKRRSHRLYIAPGALFMEFADPLTGKTLLELRADGETKQWLFFLAARIFLKSSTLRIIKLGPEPTKTGIYLSFRRHRRSSLHLARCVLQSGQMFRNNRRIQHFLPQIDRSFSFQP